MSKDISLPQPFGISLEILEQEDRLGSFRCEFTAKLPLFDGHIEYLSSGTWIAYRVYDEFLSNLKDLLETGEGNAKLYDMSDEFSYEFSSREIALNICRQVNPGFTGEINLKNVYQVEIVRNNITAIESFAKWW